MPRGPADVKSVVVTASSSPRPPPLWTGTAHGRGLARVGHCQHPAASHSACGRSVTVAGGLADGGPCWPGLSLGTAISTSVTRPGPAARPRSGTDSNSVCDDCHSANTTGTGADAGPHARGGVGVGSRGRVGEQRYGRARPQPHPPAAATPPTRTLPTTPPPRRNAWLASRARLRPRDRFNPSRPPHQAAHPTRLRPLPPARLQYHLIN